MFRIRVQPHLPGMSSMFISVCCLPERNCRWSTCTPGRELANREYSLACLHTVEGTFIEGLVLVFHPPEDLCLLYPLCAISISFASPRLSPSTMKSPLLLTFLWPLALRPALSIAYWRMACSVSQTARVDLILSPGQVSGHVHKFAGGSSQWIGPRRE